MALQCRTTDDHPGSFRGRQRASNLGIAVELWAPAGQIFNVRQGKFLVCIIGSGELTAYIFGGVSIP